jgi:23S rRNA pseudouridine1911/1915/1917 synthase
LKSADVVRLLVDPAPPPARERDVRVVFFDEQVVVVEKPAGITTNRHPSERNWPARRKQLQPTLDEMLPRIVAKLDQSGKSAKREKQAREKRASKAREPRRWIRPVHRLDRETSGLMVFARTVGAESHLGKQFRQHSVQRRYLAIAVGRLQQARTIRSNITRDRGVGRRGSTPHETEGKHAVTHVRPLEDLGEYTLVECRLETGRTHQIRIHLAELGHPLCGEKVYQKQPGRPVPMDASGSPRIALHAAELGFVHPTSERPMHFEMQLPADLKQLLQRLRRQKATRSSAEA